MNRSPLHELTADLGARFTDFGGWEMPVQYTSVLGEHRAIRTASGVFDVTHLGRFELSGARGRESLRALLCNDIDRIEPGRCQYTMMLNDAGGIVDDLIVWWLEEDLFWVMPNAANQKRVMSAFADFDCEVKDLQKSTVFLAVQGPVAKDKLREFVDPLPGRFRVMRSRFGDGILTVAGTGYTGEAGVEICCDPDTGTELLSALVDAGVTPCGLGARDTLRLEAGFPLWGQDIDEATTPLEADLGFALSLEHEFTGKKVLVDQSKNGVQRRLASFVLTERGVPRHGYQVRTRSGATGVVTSGNHSPILNMGIGMAYLTPPVDVAETIEVEIRDRWVDAKTANAPLHKQDK